MHQNWTWTRADQDTVDELRAFLPDRAFDIHAHLYRFEDLNFASTHLCATGPPVASWEEWEKHVGRQMSGTRLEGGLFFPFPGVTTEKMPEANAFLLQELRNRPGSRGLVLIHPQYPQAELARHLESPQVAGFKVYHVYSPLQPTFIAPTASFLPDWAWRHADERRLIIMLHLVRDRALADRDNHEYLVRMCRRHPRAQVVLAHAARGFHAPDTRRGLPALQGIENVWFDTSAICESEPLSAIIEAFGPRRLLWGSDFPVSMLRGKCVTVGDGFAWLQPDTVLWDKITPACQPVLVGLESLRALRQAAAEAGLSQEDVEDIFVNNALRLLRRETPAGSQTQQLYAHAKQRIPGGTQLLSKRPEMLAPNQWPAYFREARGCEVWDLDGRHYYDMSTNGIGACLLGFREPHVTAAVRRRLTLGSMCTLNPPEEVALADLLCELHPWAEQVRLGRSGGEAVAMAVRIARATTGRSLVAVCGYHGWHDWYLAANLSETDQLVGHPLPGLALKGVPVELSGTTFMFKYNAPEEFEDLVARHGDRLAAVVMEPCRHHPPRDGFLETIRDRARDVGALLVFDEITIGWRLCRGGAHQHLGVAPDLAVFAKALGNGHPIAAVIGTSAAMAGVHESFVSSTYWTESIGPTAALATIARMQAVDVPAHIAAMGDQVRAHWKTHAAEFGLPVVVDNGFPCLANFRFEHSDARILITYYTQLMLDRGFLAGGAIYPTLAHTPGIVSAYGAAVREVFAEIRDALDTNQVEQRLRGPVAHSGFRRLT